jgi:hypothetical protein
MAPLYFAASSLSVGAGVDASRSDPASTWAGLSLSARFPVEALASPALESFPMSCWEIARGLAGSSVPVESLRGSGTAVALPGEPTPLAKLEVELRFCDVVSNFPMRFATEGRGRSSGSGLSRERKNDQRRVGLHGERC